MNDVLLSAKNLTKRFGGLAAVNDVSLDLWRGRIHAVIGPNGAGKSTLTNLLSGDLPPTSGSVLLGGRDVTGWSPEKISAGTGPQLPEDQHLPALHRLGKRSAGFAVARTACGELVHSRYKLYSYKRPCRKRNRAFWLKKPADQHRRHHQPWRAAPA